MWTNAARAVRAEFLTAVMDVMVQVVPKEYVPVVAALPLRSFKVERSGKAREFGKLPQSTITITVVVPIKGDRDLGVKCVVCVIEGTNELYGVSFTVYHRTNSSTIYDTVLSSYRALVHVVAFDDVLAVVEAVKSEEEDAARLLT